jgi:two-component system, cell cycle response regulator
VASSDETAVTDVSQPVPSPRANDCLVIIHQRSAAAGKHYRLGDSPIRIGRDADNEIVLDDPGVSRRHARLERRQQQLVLMDVGSKNGTLLNDRELAQTIELKNGDRIKIGATIFKYLSADDLEAALHEQIYVNTITDNLTQLHNRWHFDGEFAREFSRSRRHHRPLSLLVIDIDHFKNVNDTHGHHVGDITLKAVSDAVRSSLRAEDIVARFGGEEIAVILPEATLDQAAAAAEKLRALVAELVVQFRDLRLSVTVSVGCASLEDGDADPTSFFERCDQKMYEAKAAGRNSVRF